MGQTVKYILWGVGGLSVLAGVYGAFKDLSSAEPTEWRILVYLGFGVFFSAIIVNQWLESRKLKKQIKDDLDAAREGARQEIITDFRKPYLRKLPQLLSKIEQRMRAISKTKIKGVRLTLKDISHLTGRFHQLTEQDKDYKQAYDELTAVRHGIGDKLLNEDIELYLNLLLEVYDRQFWQTNERGQDLDRKLKMSRALRIANELIGKRRTIITNRIEQLLACEDRVNAK